ncbi:hypothetical protein RSOLAG22IIIB_07920 [Rhizoctonia solani]|uniref:Uncharacterized protein n=1 Tax=Rhizoctonia solani TaxID=456999 RepID=A0A0K6FQP8_9AGAM|nr:hypothetical protein RSOLAG22IIIB_07920 [Rhizoctonia solani]
MFFTRLALIATAAAFATASPIDDVKGQMLSKRDISYGNPDRVTDQGDRFQLNYGSTEGHPNACPGHYVCYIHKNGAPHDEVPLGNPDLMVDEGNRWRLNYGSANGHPNACDGHYICYINK